MNPAELRFLDDFPEPEFEALRTLAFIDFGEPSRALAEVHADEADRSRQIPRVEEKSSALRIGAFVDNVLVGWSFSKAEDRQLHTIHSGVHPHYRQRGIYKQLVEATIAYARAQAFTRLVSRHVPDNNAVIIPKLRAGFVISAFEYSEIYGPVVHLTYLVGDKRRELYRARSRPITPPAPD